MARPAAAAPLGGLVGESPPAVLGGASLRAGSDPSPVRQTGQQRLLGAPETKATPSVLGAGRANVPLPMWRLRRRDFRECNCTLLST
jgi:hypothetical protein